MENSHLLVYSENLLVVVNLRWSSSSLAIVLAAKRVWRSSVKLLLSFCVVMSSNLYFSHLSNQTEICWTDRLHSSLNALLQRSNLTVEKCLGKRKSNLINSQETCDTTYIVVSPTGRETENLNRKPYVQSVTDDRTDKKWQGQTSLSADKGYHNLYIKT